jgi:hypothetical protein
MNSWTRHLARSLFRLAGRPIPAEEEEDADRQPDPPPRRADDAAESNDADHALLRACSEFRAGHARGDQALAAVPEGAWRQFADAMVQSDGALDQAVAEITTLRAHGSNGLRAKAEALRIVLDGAGEDAELATRIARSLIEDVLAVTSAPASRG